MPVLPGASLPSCRIVCLSQVRVVERRYGRCVTLKHGDREVPAELVAYKLHVPSVKDFFGLGSLLVDGRLVATDEKGFTFKTYLSGATMQITGTPIAGLLTSVDMLCCSVVTVVFHSDIAWLMLIS